MTIDDHCDGSCSSIYTPGSRIVSNEEIERDLDEMLNRDLDPPKESSLVLKYNLAMDRVKDSFPRVYRVLNIILPHPY